MLVYTILGARPQFIKAAPVCRELALRNYEEVIIHTGQHYDENMSDVFFRELGIPNPLVNLKIGSGNAGWQVGQMVSGLSEFLTDKSPDWVLVYGDTNTTLAGSLAATKANLPLVHIEAGLRSFNRSMPEELNRILTDHMSDLRLCPSQRAVKLLSDEGINDGVHFVGDTMYDSLLHSLQISKKRSKVLKNLGLKDKDYLLLTLHRGYNVDSAEPIISILKALTSLPDKIIFPVHPRTCKQMKNLTDLPKIDGSNIKVIDPLGYIDMLALENGARMILTDSGGVQKEAFFLGVPCITLRPETEWMETIEAGWNILTGSDPGKIIEGLSKTDWPSGLPPLLYGNGQASIYIVDLLASKNP